MTKEKKDKSAYRIKQGVAEEDYASAAYKMVAVEGVDRETSMLRPFFLSSL
jgi:hypothetical protein